MTRRLIPLLVLLVLPSCLARTLTIETTPPGATVYMDHVPLGKTPLTTDFTHGGIREFLILHEDDPQNAYKPLRVRQDTESFAYDVFPFDFFVAIAPVTVRDDHHFSFSLEPIDSVATFDADEDSYIAALLERAADMRRRAKELQQTAPPPAPPLLPAGDDRKRDGDKPENP